MSNSQKNNKSTILIVDDQPVIIRALSKLLKDDYRVLAATNGKKALDIANGDQQPDLILLDINMPEMGGYEVCRGLKSHESTKDIPVIFVTARNEDGEEEKGFLLGASDYIVKPFNPAVVRARIKTNVEYKLSREALEQKIIELRKVLDEIKTLRGIVPICSNCKNVRNDKGYWQQVEVYVREHSEAEFSHSLCPGCVKELYPDIYSSIIGDEADKKVV